VANWISKFLSAYHGIDPQTKGASTVSLFWGLMTAGCLLGLLLLKLFDSRRSCRFCRRGDHHLVCLSIGPGGDGCVLLMGFARSCGRSSFLALTLDRHLVVSEFLSIIGGALCPRHRLAG
jgi:uncharacterized membrane protein YedE/YeeE